MGNNMDKYKKIEAMFDKPFKQHDENFCYRLGFGHIEDARYARAIYAKYLTDNYEKTKERYNLRFSQTSDNYCLVKCFYDVSPAIKIVGNIVLAKCIFIKNGQVDVRKYFFFLSDRFSDSPDRIMRLERLHEPELMDKVNLKKERNGRV